LLHSSRGFLRLPRVYLVAVRLRFSPMPTRVDLH
jgi:hypothetical protein